MAHTACTVLLVPPFQTYVYAHDGVTHFGKEVAILDAQGLMVVIFSSQVT